MRFFMITLGFACLSAIADTYTRGTGTCESLSRAETGYNENPNSIIDQEWYGKCLIRAGQDEKGLALVQRAMGGGSISSAYFLARYYETNGTLVAQGSEPENLQLAINTYLQVRQMIRNHHGYPIGGYTYSEGKHKMEMKSYYKPVALYYDKFLKGAMGAENLRLNGDQEGGTCEPSPFISTPPPCESYLPILDPDLPPTFPEYRTYTTDSLQKMIKHANACLNVQIPHPYRRLVAERFYQACRILKHNAEAILNQGLEDQRNQLLHDEPCALDLNNCTEYQNVREEIMAIISEGNRQLDAVWAMPEPPHPPLQVTVQPKR